MKELFSKEQNCWRIERAARFGVMIDAAHYYAALRDAMLKAENSVFIVGWDIDSRIRLAGAEDPDDDAPIKLRDFLCHLAENKPSLRVHVLMWDFSVLYALEREPMPALNLAWSTPKNVEICLDDIVPLGASHHQKIVIIDGKIAFCGGLDLAAYRWDTRAHDPNDKLRVDARGVTYRPFHDMQAIVDGGVAQALTDLVCERWENAACRAPQVGEGAGDPWPDIVEPMFTDIDVAIARTVAPMGGRPGVFEVERMYLDMIGVAENFIYIENQFLTADSVADALVDALSRHDGLEVILVTSRDPHGFLEEHSMATGRARFMKRLSEFSDRVRLVHPRVDDGSEDGQKVLVHAKLTIIDDKVLRIGSSNLNRRSMGTDGECDLIVEATKDDERARILNLRDDLLAEHLEMDLNEVAGAIEEAGGLCALIDARQDRPRTLAITDPAVEISTEISNAFEAVADPERPNDVSQFVGDFLSARPVGPTLSGKVLVGIGVVLVVALISLWQFSPLAQYTDPDRLKDVLSTLRGDPWAYVIVPISILVGSMVVFPVTVMIAACAIVFPAPSAFFIAFGGCLLGAAANYAVGQAIGRTVLRRMLGKRLNKISRSLAKRGVLTVATLRIVPVAPFTLINVVAGASHIGFVAFMVGTLIGMLPGVATMTLIGNRLFALFDNPGTVEFLYMGGALAAWFGVGYLAQIGLKRLQDGSE